MSGVRAGVAWFALAAWFTAPPALAQGFVPGGWAPEVGIQQFGGAGFFNDVPAGFNFNSGVPAFGGGFAPFGNGGFNPYAQGFSTSGYAVGGPFGFAAATPPLTVNAMDPLIHAIRQTTMRRRAR
jgi:hypothetical protein